MNFWKGFLGRNIGEFLVHGGVILNNFNRSSLRNPRRTSGGKITFNIIKFVPGVLLEKRKPEIICGKKCLRSSLSCYRMKD